MSTFFNRMKRPEPEIRSGNAPNGRPYESVWSYPRPPEIRPEPRLATVASGGVVIASSSRAVRVCETAGGPVVYLPAEDIVPGALRPSGGGGSFCEWKGAATYFDVVLEGEAVPRAAWSYPSPSPAFEQIAGCFSFYPALVECRLDGELVMPQPGGFYGGWMTSEITGPVKGEPGTGGW
jgi:uncharacterized protein (DUF427 family)